MNTDELDKLLLDIKELKSSVRKANPFLRDIMALRAYAILSFPLGILLLADSLVTHFLVLAHGSFGAIPEAWKIVSISIFAAIAAIGSISKWIAIDRRAAQLRQGANFLTAMEAIYGGSWFHFSIPLALAMLVTSIFVAVIGHPWLAVSFVAVFWGPFCNIVAKLLDRREYLYTGWYLSVTGLASLFFIEATPFLWLAIVWAGTFLVFGWTGIAASKADRAGRP